MLGACFFLIRFAVSSQFQNQSLIELKKLHYIYYFFISINPNVLRIKSIKWLFLIKTKLCICREKVTLDLRLVTIKKEKYTEAPFILLYQIVFQRNLNLPNVHNSVDRNFLSFDH